MKIVKFAAISGLCLIFWIEFQANIACNRMYIRVCSAQEFLPPYNWIHEWQTLITGVFAIAAAFYGAKFVYRQTEQDRTFEDQRRDGKLFATRAMLPFILSEYADYCDGCAEELDRLRSHCKPGTSLDTAAGPVCFPSVPSSATERLIAFIEAAHGEPRERAASLLRCIQVQASRLSSIRASISGSRRIHLIIVKHNLNSYLVDTAVIYAISVSIFEYARGAADNVAPPPSVDKISTCLNLLGFDSSTHPDVYEIVTQVVRHRNSLRW